MTPDEINKAIAEHLGWQFLPERDTRLGPQPELWEDPDGERYFETPLSNWPPYPNFCEDLNAMHKAVSVIEHDVWQYQNYCDNLCVLANGLSAEMDGSYIEVFKMLQATAAQRAEAFLKTIGKWKE